MSHLTQIQFYLPAIDKTFEERFLQFLSPVGKVAATGIDLALSNKNFIPKTSFIFESAEHPFVLLALGEGSPTKIEIANRTGIAKESPYHYTHIALDEFARRMQAFPLQGLDHTGFNLPYFNGVHPRILELREELKDKCLYHTFPKHLEDAPWDFIIPGTKEEIDRSRTIDYQKTRKPKIEIVSFENSSTPLIQIDIQVQGTYEDMVKTFPEALHVPEIKNMWVYLRNDFGVDVCFVLNEAVRGDWSYQFRNDRIK